MKAHLTRRYMFSASHRLHSEAMSADENLATYGKCNNPYGHGHNYALEVTVSGPVDPATGMVCNLVDLDRLSKGRCSPAIDQENLNMLAGIRAELFRRRKIYDRDLRNIAARLHSRRIWKECD